VSLTKSSQFALTNIVPGALILALLFLNTAVFSASFSEDTFIRINNDRTEQVDNTVQSLEIAPFDQDYSFQIATYTSGKYVLSFSFDQLLRIQNNMIQVQFHYSNEQSKVALIYDFLRKNNLLRHTLNDDPHQL
jgi:hypothetical protein